MEKTELNVQKIDEFNDQLKPFGLKLGDTKMEKVNWFKETSCRWSCPNCSSYNDEDTEPQEEDTIVCEGCGEEFEVGEQEY